MLMMVADRPVVAVALGVADPALRRRLTGVLAEAPGLEPVAEPGAADVLIAQAVPPRGGRDAPPVLVLAEGAAAQAAALRAGARGVLPPDAGAAQIAAALVALARGLVVAPPGLVPPPPATTAAAPVVVVAAEPAAGSLTPREREVLALLAAGAANKVIARRLGVSFHTAKAHVASVLAKLGASSRADAVARGVRAGLVLL
jgi:DNA-binding NarL/FixJ family response regulator